MGRREREREKETYHIFEQVLKGRKMGVPLIQAIKQTSVPTIQNAMNFYLHIISLF